MLCMAIFTLTMAMVAVHHTFSQRYDVRIKSTNNSSYFWEQNIEKPEVHFGVKWCSGSVFTVLCKDRSSVLYYVTMTRLSDMPHVRVKIGKCNESGWEKKKSSDMQFDCSPYTRLKITWIKGEIAVWYIQGSTWNNIVAWRDPGQNNARQISTIRLKSTNEARWRVYYNDHTAIRNREICINF